MNFHTISKCILLAPVALGLAQTPKPATPPSSSTASPRLTLEDIPGADPIVLIVGDEKMTKTAFERLLAGLPEQVRSRARTPEGKRKIAEQVVQLEALAQEAKKRGLDKSAETKELLKFQTDNVLASALFKELSASVKPDDAAAHAYYEKHKSEYEQVAASHILIRFKGSQLPMRPGEKDLTEEEALAKVQDLRKRILAGEDFAKLAAAESDDTSTGKNGGSLGIFAHGRMVQDFDQAAFKLPVGELSEPVKTQFGYHLIKVTKHETKTFDQVKAQIEQHLRPAMAQEAAETIRKQTNVTMNESYFGPPAPAAPAPAAALQKR